jgi:hypothetical protein
VLIEISADNVAKLDSDQFRALMPGYFPYTRVETVGVIRRVET